VAELRPKVGIGVMVVKEGKYLMGKRKGSHGEGEYACPGGHLEFGESIAECCKREVKEETGMEIDNIRFVRFLNFKTEGKHYADVMMISDWKSGEPQVLEPEKCEGWDWYDLDNLPKPLFGTLSSGIEAIRTGKTFFDN
jgi:8-oxo-dGTP diphosphatase